MSAAGDAPHAAATLERVCLHEYAHCVLACALGAAGFVRIARVLDAAPAAVRYAGAFQMHGALADRDWRIVALAGTLAEWLADDPALDAAAAHGRLAGEAGALAASDAALAAGFDLCDVQRCLALLREHWHAVVAQARERADAVRAGTAG